MHEKLLGAVLYVFECYTRKSKSKSKKILFIVGTL